MSIAANVRRIVFSLATRGLLSYELDYEELQNLYKTEVETLPSLWYSGDKWGNGPEETFEFFERVSAEIIFGERIKKWPRVSLDWRKRMSITNIPKEWYERRNEPWYPRFLDIESEYDYNEGNYFNNIIFFEKLLKIYPEGMNKGAAWWNNAEYISKWDGMKFENIPLMTSIVERPDINKPEEVLNLILENKLNWEEIHEYSGAGECYSLYKARQRIKDAPEWFYTHFAYDPFINKLNFDELTKVSESVYTDLWYRDKIALTVLSPQELAEKLNGGCKLTKKEAAEWIKTLSYIDPPSPKEFLWDKIMGDTDIHMPWNITTDVMYWLRNKKDNPAMYRKRRIYGPGGRIKDFRYIDILDEIAPEDLLDKNGKINYKKSPDAVFKNAAERLQKIIEAETKDVKLPKCPIPGNDKVKQIITSDGLKTEGKEMNNCVATYVKSCISQVSYIFHINEPGGRATIELYLRREKWSIGQIFGPENSKPSKEIMQIVKEWATANNLENIAVNQFEE